MCDHHHGLALRHKSFKQLNDRIRRASIKVACGFIGDEQGRVTCHGARNGGKLLCSERHWGSISRTFSLAHDIDDTKVQAKYADGVLTLELPKKNTSTLKKVTVQ